jgi:isopentenyl diphosphate isomerase/L-lactate dehydrogenase-like FMN-dependent dehydrogenase
MNEVHPIFTPDVAAAQASAATGVPYTLSTFPQTRMEDVAPHAGNTPIFYQLYLPSDRELAASLINRAETSGYSALFTVDSWTLGFGRWTWNGETFRNSAATACRTTTRM